MSFYIEVPERIGKAGQLVELYGAKHIPAVKTMQSFHADAENSGKIPVCIVKNPMFEAAMLCYEQVDLDRVWLSKEHGDQRPTVWMSLDLEVALRECDKLREYVEAQRA